MYVTFTRETWKILQGLVCLFLSNNITKRKCPRFLRDFSFSMIITSCHMVNKLAVPVKPKAYCVIGYIFKTNKNT